MKPTAIDDGEVLRTPYDKRTDGLPREGQLRTNGGATKRPVLWAVRHVRRAAIRAAMNGPAALNREQADSVIAYPVDWVIAGGESGSGFRAMDPAWARDLWKQAARADIAFFFKQSSGSRPGQGVELLGEVVQQFPGGALPREDVEPGGRGG